MHQQKLKRDISIRYGISFLRSVKLLIDVEVGVDVDKQSQVYVPECLYNTDIIIHIILEIIRYY